MEQTEGNGSGTAKGAQLDLATLQREDGIIPRSILSGNRDNSGVIAKAMTAIDKNADYRQELKTGYFSSPKKQMQMVLALDECRECGVDDTLVVDLLIAQKAGERGGFMHDIFEALTHTTFSTNYRGGKNGHWWNKGESNNNSPLA